MGLFAAFWKDHLQAPPFILNVLKGYKIPLLDFPPLLVPSLNRRHSFSAEKTALIEEEIASMISKNAIEEIPPSPSFLSNLFIVPKKDGGH